MRLVKTLQVIIAQLITICNVMTNENKAILAEYLKTDTAFNLTINLVFSLLPIDT